MRFLGKVVIISGASSGIGLKTAVEFYREGALISLTSRNLEKLKENISKELNPLDDSRILLYEGNVRNYRDMVNFVEKTVGKFGKVDILINNAGVTDDKLFIRMTEEDWREVLETNLYGVIHLTHATVKHMIREKRGVIINISSIVGIVGNPGQCIYSASKAGIIAFSKSLAKELGSRNIRVLALAPGFVVTPMTEKLKEDIKHRYLESISLKRFTTPEEVARVVLFLASDEASYITGQTIVIDGGLI